MKIFTILVFLMTLCSSIYLSAQKETYNWYFGDNAGITFAPLGKNPTLIYDSEIKAPNGSSCVSDVNGNNLFYTNSETIWTRLNKPMIGGANIHGHRENHMTGVSFRDPIYPDIYYLFNTGRYKVEYDNLTGTYDTLLFPSLKLQLVDMSELGGVGKVRRLNIIQRHYATEQVIAIKEGCDSMIVITQDFFKNELYGFLIYGHPDGYVHELGLLASAPDTKNPEPAAGSMAYHPRPALLAEVRHKVDVVNLYSVKDGPDINYFGRIDFNKIEYRTEVGTPEDKEITVIEYKDIFDMEYSLTGEYLYLTCTKRITTILRQDNQEIQDTSYVDKATLLRIHYKHLYDYVENGVQFQPEDLISVVSNKNTVLQNLYQLESGPDGNMYVVDYRVMQTGKLPIYSLSVITNCESQDITNLKYEYKFTDEFRGKGLPNFPPFYKYNLRLDFINTDVEYIVCKGSDLEIDANPKDYYEKIIWEGPNGFYLESDTLLIENADLSASGDYYMTSIDYFCNSFIDTVKVKVDDIKWKFEPGTYSICKGDSLTFEAPDDVDYFKWSNNTFDTKFVTNQSGKYWLYIDNDRGCSDTVHFEVQVLDSVKIDITASPAPYICGNGSVTLHASSTYDIDYSWSTGEVADSIVVTEAGVYSATSLDDNGCIKEGSIEIFKYELPPVELEVTNNNFCLGDAATISSLNTYQSYKWSTGETTKDITVTQAGTYKLVAYNEVGCSDSAEVVITTRPMPEFTIETIIDVPCSGVVELRVNSTEPYALLWSTGETTESITVTASGTYSVKATHAEGCEAEQSIDVDVTDIDEPIIDASAPALCEGNSVTLIVSQDYAEYLWSTGETTKEITVTQPGIYEVTVSNDAQCQASTSIEITEEFVDIVAPATLDFGTRIVGSVNTLPIDLVNNSSGPVKINSYTIDGGFVLTNPQALTPMFENTLQLVIEYTSPVPSQNSGELILEIVEPCEQYLYITLTGSTYSSTSLKIDGRKTTPGESVCLPVYGKLNTEDQNATYQGDIDFEFVHMADVFFVRNVVNGLKVNEYPTIANNISTNTIRFENVVVDNEYQKIGEICGDIYLGSAVSSDLTMQNAVWNIPGVETIYENNILEIESCAYGLSNVLELNPVSIQINPNPASDEASVKLSNLEPGRVHIEVIDITGTVVLEQTFETSGREITKNLDISKLGSGFYILQLQNESMRQMTKFMINN